MKNDLKERTADGFVHYLTLKFVSKSHYTFVEKNFAETSTYMVQKVRYHLGCSRILRVVQYCYHNDHRASIVVGSVQHGRSTVRAQIFPDTFDSAQNYVHVLNTGLFP